jgi:hypothetical protein
MAIYEEAPILDLVTPSGDKSTILKLSETLQAPHLRHLALIGFALPILRSRLLTTAMGLVTLAPVVTDRSNCFYPKCSAPMAIIHAPAGDAHAHAHLFIHRFRL